MQKRGRAGRVSLIFLTMLLLTFSFVTALSDFQVKFTKITYAALPGEKAVYQLSITNLNEEPDSFILNFYNGNKWSIETEKLSYLSGINLQPGQTVSFKIYVIPSEIVNYGPHEFNLDITSKKGGNSQQVSSILIVKDPSNTVGGYIPSINLDVDFPEQVDPRQPFELKINLLNKNKLNIPELKVMVESKLFNGDKMISLAPLERKTESFTVIYDPLTPPQNDLLMVTVAAEEGSFSTKKVIKVKAYSDLKTEEDVNKQFLKEVITKTFTNDGNVVNNEKITFKTTLFNQLFTSAMPKGEVITEEGERYFTWTLDIPPQEKQIIVISTNFRYLFTAIILLILGVIAYFVFRSPVIISKEAVVLNKDDANSNMSHIKVLIHVKNRTNKPVEEVFIMDRVTHIAQVEKEFSHGTLAPDKILKHEKKGTVIRWSIAALEGYEERILTYKIKSRLKIIGNMRLPYASAKFKTASGHIVKVNSNTALAANE